MVNLIPGIGTLILASGLAWVWFEARFDAPAFVSEDNARIEEISNSDERSVPFPDAPNRDFSRDAILERPLFEPGRRPGDITPEIVPVVESEPDPEPEVAEEALPSPTPALSLLGTVTSEDNNLALISVDGAPPEWMELRDAIDEWTIATVGQQFIEIERADERIRVELFE